MSPKQTISRITRLVLPAALALAIVPSAAFAADGAGKHVSVVGGYSMVEPTRNPEIAGARNRIRRGERHRRSASPARHRQHRRRSRGADSYGQRVTAGGQKVGSVDAQPYSLSGHTGSHGGKHGRPFVGLGYHQTNYNNESATWP